MRDKLERRFEHEAFGVTTVVLLRRNEVAWEMRGWKKTIGLPKLAAEGDPFLVSSFDSYEIGQEAFVELCVEVIENPDQMQMKTQPRIDIETQKMLDDSAREDFAEHVMKKGG